ncbi:MAG: hypothetical protein HRU11_12110 [Parvularculaceae bacterium]|nr:hypothetical protein [Parvularculaceae bacterium]
MSLGNIALGIIVVAVLAYAGLLTLGAIALFPEGLIGLVFLFGMGFFLIAVILQRAGDKEDRHYSKNVKE